MWTSISRRLHHRSHEARLCVPAEAAVPPLPRVARPDHFKPNHERRRDGPARPGVGATGARRAEGGETGRAGGVAGAMLAVSAGGLLRRDLHRRVCGLDGAVREAMKPRALTATRWLDVRNGRVCWGG